MPITAQYDREADALYVRLADGDRARAIEIDDTTYVDLDTDDCPIGIELLYPSTGVNLVGVAKRLALEPRLAEIIAAITTTDAPVAPLTMTGGQYLASTSMVFRTLEGSVAAGVGSVPGATAPQPGPLIHAHAGC